MLFTPRLSTEVVASRSDDSVGVVVPLVLGDVVRGPVRDIELIAIAAILRGALTVAVALIDDGGSDDTSFVEESTDDERSCSSVCQSSGVCRPTASSALLILRFSFFFEAADIVRSSPDPVDNPGLLQLLASELNPLVILTLPDVEADADWDGVLDVDTMGTAVPGT